MYKYIWENDGDKRKASKPLPSLPSFLSLNLWQKINIKHRNRLIKRGRRRRRRRRKKKNSLGGCTARVCLCVLCWVSVCAFSVYIYICARSGGVERIRIELSSSSWHCHQVSDRRVCRVCMCVCVPVLYVIRLDGHAIRIPADVWRHSRYSGCPPVNATKATRAKTVPDRNRIRQTGPHHGHTWPIHHGAKGGQSGSPHLTPDRSKIFKTSYNTEQAGSTVRHSNGGGGGGGTAVSKFNILHRIQARALKRLESRERGAVRCGHIRSVVADVCRHFFQRAARPVRPFPRPSSRPSKLRLTVVILAWQAVPTWRR